ncbi:aldehyde dehydrogenase family protein [Thalassospira sp. GO-4]|jgi:acyl-CoA reductase-like NAD-dependent aldehyde dehydrogenase|uniref:aldehyde dehydrogenase family protein n=1 Tax=Thalassospira sp. GO-4 TaxID=2946605 RepID=UPI0020255D48|nr:aldehyde dehydrogenase family protein [Thalassospira sp. GO-4]URK18776.1 aldehyde dehydrogenase family protein [Thalassospira sp. GO-4]
MPFEPNLDPMSLATELSGHHLIDGKLVAPKNGKTFDVINPATGKVIGQAADGDADDVAIAVDIAKKAQKDWAERPARERGKLVAECGRVLMAHTEELGRLVALESGKALRTESRVEASVLADMFVFFGGLASELKGETVPFNPNMMTLTTREAVGVVGAIIPWNVPLLLMAIKVAPALVAGNTVVVKSAEDTPLTVLRVCQIMQEILPAGVLNILSGFGPSCGGPLVEHKDVKKVSFTGSVETGRTVYKAAAEKLIPVTLELGGKSPMIVMDDADLDKAVAGAIGGMRFTRQGQSCTASSRMLVHEKLHDEFVKRLIDKVNTLKMGNPLDEETDIGTIINRKQFDKVCGYIDIGEKEGATKHELSALPTDAELSDGLFVRPVIFTNVDPNARIAREEIFGPVACVFKFKTFEEALELANDSDFGLAATVWTTDLKTALVATKCLEAGFVQVNQNLVVQPNLSYGGIKLSGLGKEASLESMLEHFTYKKTVILNME